MSVQILDVYDRERGCGWRHEGGMYLTGAADMLECYMLPFALNECACCGQRVKLTRGLQKVNVRRLTQDAECSSPTSACQLCLIKRTEDAWLIGVGHKHYKTRDAYLREAIEMGISKRIAQIPRGFEVGKSVILIGYPKVFTDYVPEGAVDKPIEIDDDAPQQGLPMIDVYSETTGRMVAKDIPGVICLFVPQRIEYVVAGNETEEYLESLVARNVTLVRVHHIIDQQLLLEKNE